MIRSKSLQLKKKLSIAFLTLILLPAAYADERYTARQMSRGDVASGRGQCDIRLRIDNEAEVSIRGMEISVRIVQGAPSRDEGSECNQPLPTNPSDFRFDVRDSRDSIKLLEGPTRANGGRAIIAIRDNSGGAGRYHFRLSWDINASDNTPVRSGRSGGRYNRSINSLMTEQRGSGTFRYRGSEQIVRAAIDLRPTGDFRLRLTGNQDYALTGRWSEDNNRIELDIIEGPMNSRSNGRGTVYLNRRDIDRIQLSGRDNRGTFDLDFQAGSGSGLFDNNRNSGRQTDTLFPNSYSTQIPREGACFYSETNYRGDFFCLETGQRLGTIENGWDRRIMSIRLYGRPQLRLYSDTDYRGESMRAYANMPDLNSFRFAGNRRWAENLQSLTID